MKTKYLLWVEPVNVLLSFSKMQKVTVVKTFLDL